ncbi:hypothetical protein ACHHYP_03117 [Achlya hypogyna]|uniref:Tyrosinase copper-binding domain-containing protein n=1 Tax=Achlya hypogyna TaxID=1202772 RepID=A0A1V9Z4B6_ACHHY|nr:hypothetical protein ACHHYP_03117 [Achlya hypogyna]
MRTSPLVLIFGLASVAAQILFPAPAPTPAPTAAPGVPVTCPVPATRQPWLLLSPADQQTYLDAVALAMDKGYHFYFVQILAESSTWFEYYTTCGWAYSSRKLLLAYERMLRSLGPAYACITIPYWDFFADNAQVQTGDCSGTLSGCSSILGSFGGASGVNTSISMDNETVWGYASTGYPLNHFCELYNIRCSNFVPRGNWNVPFPQGFGYGIMANLLNKCTSFFSYTFGLKNGIRSNMQTALGGAMAAPNRTMADPLFFSQHAALDMMVQVYIACYLGTNVSATKKQTSPWAFSRCGPSFTSSSQWPTSLSKVTLRLPVSYANHSAVVDAVDHPVVGQFFAPLPTYYYEYADSTDLGAFSYDYNKNALVTSFLANGYICPVTIHRRLRRMEGITSPVVLSAAARTRTTAVQKIVDVKDLITTEAMRLCKGNFTKALELYAIAECMLSQGPPQPQDTVPLEFSPAVTLVFEGSDPMPTPVKVEDPCKALLATKLARSGKSFRLAGFMAEAFGQQ